MSLSRQCPFAGCKKRIPPEKFACYPHWMSLNARQKAAIWECYCQWLSGEIDGDELRQRQQAVLDEVEGR